MPPLRRLLLASLVALLPLSARPRDAVAAEDAAPQVELTFRELHCIETEDRLFAPDMELDIRVKGRSPNGKTFDVEKQLEDCREGKTLFSASRSLRLWKGRLPANSEAVVDVRIDENDDAVSFGDSSADYAGGFRLTVRNKDGRIEKRLETYASTRHAGGKVSKKRYGAFSPDRDVVRMRLTGEGDLLAAIGLSVDGAAGTWERSEIARRSGKPFAKRHKPSPAPSSDGAAIHHVSFTPAVLTAGHDTKMTVCIEPQDKPAVLTIATNTRTGVTSTLRDEPRQLNIAPGTSCVEQVLRTERRVNEPTTVDFTVFGGGSRSATLIVR